MLREVLETAREEYWRVGLSPVPPPCEATLRIGINEYDRPLPGSLGGDGQVPRQRCLPGTTLL
jgi:hypothetical protein